MIGPIRYIEIISKDDVQFQSFRKALDSRMKAGIGAKKLSSKRIVTSTLINVTIVLPSLLTSTSFILTF